MASQELQVKRVKQASLDFQDLPEKKVTGVRKVCLENQDCRAPREIKEVSAIQVSQVDQVRRAHQACQGLQENLDMMDDRVREAYRVLLVLLEKRVNLEWTASQDPQGRGESQVSLVEVSLDPLVFWVAKVTKAVLASLEHQVILVFLVSKATRGFLVSRDPKVSQERGGFQV